MKNKENVTVICDYYDDSRYSPLRKLKKKKKIQKLDFIKLNSLKKNPLNIFPIIINLFVLLAKKDSIIIACAPLNPLIIYFMLLKKSKPTKIIYDTSFINWKTRKYLYITVEPFKTLFERLWFNFLKDMKIRCINSISYNFLKKVSKNTELIPHSVDLKKFYPDKSIEREKKFTVLFVGKIKRLKRIDLLLRLAENHRNIDFWFVGDGKMKRDIMGCDLKNVKYYGGVKDTNNLRELYNKSHVLILPSEKELFGIVLIEAMACKTPVIASKCVGPKDIIKNNKTGLLFPKGNYEELEKRLIKVYKSKPLRKKLTKNAYAKIEKKYDTLLMSDKLEKLIKK